MLIYHPSEDSNHCCYRIIRLLTAINNEPVALPTLMICDFYTLFPGQLKYISGWPRAKSTQWKKLQIIPDEYEEIINPKRIFFQLNSIQRSAISHLFSKGIIIYTGEQGTSVSLNQGLVPSKIKNAMKEDEIFKSDWFPLISTDLLKIELDGKNGLKRKTGLMEFVYD